MLTLSRTSFREQLLEKLPLGVVVPFSMFGVQLLWPGPGHCLFPSSLLPFLHPQTRILGGLGTGAENPEPKPDSGLASPGPGPQLPLSSRWGL